MTGVVRSKPRPYPAGDEFVKFSYARDFEWPGAGSAAYPLVAGDWTVVRYAVRANGDAHYLGCDGFTVR